MKTVPLVISSGALILFFSPCVHAQDGAAEVPAQKPLPAKMAAAWRNAGYDLRWAGFDQLLQNRPFAGQRQDPFMRMADLWMPGRG